MSLIVVHYSTAYGRSASCVIHHCHFFSPAKIKLFRMCSSFNFLSPVYLHSLKLDTSMSYLSIVSVSLLNIAFDNPPRKKQPIHLRYLYILFSFI